jgi:hypothetical protein
VQLRAPSGASGWADALSLSAVTPVIGRARVIDRGDDRLAIYAAPDEDAAKRWRLLDDDEVDVLERGAVWARIMDVATARVGYLPAELIDDTAGERRWLEVATVPEGTRGWIDDRALTVDVALLAATVVDDRTVSVTLARGGDVALLDALPLRPVPAQEVEEHGREWATADRVKSSGPFLLTVGERGAVLLVRRAPQVGAPSSIELTPVRSQTTALHLYRAGLVDVLLDGALPTTLQSVLAGASDYRAAAAGGGLVAPNLVGVDIGRLQLAAIRVRP